MLWGNVGKQMFIDVENIESDKLKTVEMISLLWIK
jgi:hypothetical protein